MNKAFITLGKFVFITVLIILINYLAISTFSRPKIYDTTDKFEGNHSGLLLGTGKYLSGHRINLYYLYRIRATAELYRAGRINRIVVSGDNVRDYHREVDCMIADLQNEGIPASVLIRDDNGVRTEKSIQFAANYFPDDRFIIISQPFHNERALALCSFYRVNALAYNAKEPFTAGLIKNVLRELGARIKMQLDFLSYMKQRQAN